jgi:DnaJ-domain-containing protein 1
MKKAFIIFMFLLWSFPAFTEQYQRVPQQYHPDQRVPQQFPPDHRVTQQSSSLNELPNQLVDMFMSQGIVGGMLLVLALYYFRKEQEARKDRLKLTDDLQNLVRDSLDKTDIIAVKTTSAAISQQMANLEREIETLKDYIISGRIGGKA